MPNFKAFKDVRSITNEKYISKDKVYQIVDLCFLGDKSYEFAVIDDLGEKMWFTDLKDDELSYRNYFKKVKYTIIDS